MIIGIGCDLAEVSRIKRALGMKGFAARVFTQREQDYCMAREEHELGVQALAVPLRNMGGQTLAALNLVTSPQRMEPATMLAQLLPLLQEAARELRPLL